MLLKWIIKTGTPYKYCKDHSLNGHFEMSFEHFIYYHFYFSYATKRYLTKLKWIWENKMNIGYPQEYECELFNDAIVWLL